jgi:uncharacterized membrane protein YcaP (DUF421 family)
VSSPRKRRSTGSTGASAGCGTSDGRQTGCRTIAARPLAKGRAAIGISGVGPGTLAILALRTAIVLVALIFGLRLFGRRQVGEMRTMDILVILVTANAVQNAMTKSDGHLTVSLVAGGTLIVVGWLLGKLVQLRPELELSIGGAPVILVHEGQVEQRALRREGITLGDLMAAMRQQGLTEVDEVKLAVLEMDGSISVVPADKPAKGQDA